MEKGRYTISAASSSRDIRCQAKVDMGAEAGAYGIVQGMCLAPEAYRTLKTPLQITKEDFECLYGEKLGVSHTGRERLSR